MRGVNKCTFIGNLGQDPEVKHTGSGKAVATISLAVNERWKDSNGQLKERTEWVRCVAWERKAEIIGEYCKKGTPLYVDGKLQTRSYESDGTTKYVTEIILSEVILLGQKPQGAAQPAQPASDRTEITDDDIPF